jgi:ectoine hydroxylase-related dioxygenase (phytanoyl-CoA dioxygenase family)
VQLPLTKGDAAFFNPAVFHGAGHNRSADVKRMANLLQMSSAFGRAMESVDRTTMSAAIYPELVAARSAGLSPQAVHNVVAASAEGYAFPTNLDRDQPVDGLAPRSQAEIVVHALADDWPAEALVRELAALAIRRQSA